MTHCPRNGEIVDYTIGLCSCGECPTPREGWALDRARTNLAAHDRPVTITRSRAWGENIVGARYTASIGEPFTCRVGEAEVEVPIGSRASDLPPVPDIEGGGWNERYFAHVGRALVAMFPHLEAEVEASRAFRLTPLPVTVDHLRAALAEVDRLASGLADADRARALLCTDGTLTAAVEHLGSILHDAGIGLPACDRAPTCQSLHLSARIHDLADQRNGARRELAAIDTAITATGHPPGDDYDPLRLVREVLAKVAPGPTIGGPMPEPWPGMGVEWVRENGSRSMFVADPVQDGDTWYFLTSAEVVISDDSIVAADIVAIYDGRRCIWQRNP